jgi:Transposase DNA-binding
MESCANQNFADCQLGDRRLNDRALEIGKALVVGFGQALSMLFKDKNLLKRAYEFFANPKVQFGKITQPHWQNTVIAAQDLKILLAVGDTTFLNYNSIKAKRDGYGPIGNGGNGLILHSTLAVEPELGQPLGLLWQKLWHREPKAKPLISETAKQKKARLAQERKARREQPFEQKESYRWVEAQKAVNEQFQLVENHLRKIQSTQKKTSEPATAKSCIIHIFDREGDIAEVFDQVLQMECTGVVVRAAHDRCLEPENRHLWEYLSTQPIQIYQEVELSATAKRTARTALLAVRFCPIQLRSPRRLNNQNPLKIYAVYAQEIEPIDQGEAVCWMLLTTEKVSDCAVAATILRWYTYRWRIEEYHKILKSGCKVEDYRFAAASMEAMLGFLTVIAAELLRVTYLHRTQPDAPATAILSAIQLDVLKAKSVKLPKVLTVAWAVEAVARLGGYLEHRNKTPIGIQVLWRGWLQLTSLCQGWQLAQQT